MTFSCTKKVLDHLKKYHPIETEKSDLSFHNWYVDSINLERKNYFLFTHAASLFSLFLYAGTKKQQTHISTLFTEKLKELLIREIGASEAYLNEIVPANAVFRFEKTNSRSILGNMNDYKNQIRVQIWHKGPLNETHDLIHHLMNKSVMKKDGKYVIPIRLLKEQLEERLKK